MRRKTMSQITAQMIAKVNAKVNKIVRASQEYSSDPEAQRAFMAGANLQCILDTNDLDEKETL